MKHKLFLQPIITRRTDLVVYVFVSLNVGKTSYKLHVRFFAPFCLAFCELGYLDSSCRNSAGMQLSS